MPFGVIALNKWKLPFFERHLTEAGFTFERGLNINDDVATIRVVAQDGDEEKLDAAVVAADEASQRLGPING
jgi:hypothetical protein